ncbi:FxLD family lanthipeptide [Kitasatospora sp. NPDC098663]|uniref:FxLD family lanthipeptide n=1 Tax=Kitasatospora sp. NPDC098663 TaxID=3364096 RepID=UPI00380E5597
MSVVSMTSADIDIPGDFDLDVTLLEVADPSHLVQMTDDNCGSSCSKSTCISAA